MKTIFLFIICSILSATLSQCSNSQQTKKSGEQGSLKLTSQQKIDQKRKQIAPGYCRMIGTIIEIDTRLSGSDHNDPCSKAPCLASVRIDSVLGYGSSFAAPVSSGQTIPVRFTFTTAQTKNLGLKLKQNLPGLQVNDHFQADVEGRSVFGGGVEYVVGVYEKK